MKVVIAYSKCFLQKDIVSLIPDDATWVFVDMDEKYFPIIKHCFEKNIPITVVPMNWIVADESTKLAVSTVVKKADKAVICWDGGYDDAMDVYASCRALKKPKKIAIDMDYNWGKGLPQFYDKHPEYEK